MRRMKDKEGRKVILVPFTGRLKGGYHVQVKDKTAVVDSFTLANDEAVAYTSRKKGWR